MTPDDFPRVPLGFFMLKGAELYQFCVARAARGTGTAAALMAQAEAELGRRGVTTAPRGSTKGADG